MPSIGNLVQETTTSSGLGSLTLTASVGKQRFSGEFGTGSGNTFYYFISNQTANEWEVGIGYMSDTNTLVRSSVIESSNSNMIVNFTGGTKDVVNDLPAAYQVKNNEATTFTATAAGGATRNSFALFPTAGSVTPGDYTIGHSFVPADFITVSELGRLYVAGNTQNHQIAIWEKATPTLITSATILAASPSDANGFKYVSITPVVLDPAKEYVIAALETSVDNWKNSWDSTDYFDQFIRRTGWAFVGGTTLTKPTTFGDGVFIYNACTFKFTTASTPQVKAAYDATNFFGMLARSDGSSTFLAGGSDKTVGILNPLSLGGGTIPAGYQMGINGGMRIAGTAGIQAVTQNGDIMYLGILDATNKNAVGNQGGFLFLESGAGAGQVLINYSNSLRDVSVGFGIGTGKVNIFVDSASKVGHKVRLAASATANAYQVENNAGTVLTAIKATGVINLPSFTVATLPAGAQGDRCFVTDANAPTFLAAVAGGGAVKCPVFHDGVSWKVG